MEELDQKRVIAVAAIAAALIYLLRLFTAPATVWELDETLFTLGVEAFEPRRHHPHPPGYPLTIFLGKLLTLVGIGAFRALVTVSIVSSAVSAFALTIACSRLTRSAAAGFAGALLFHTSASMLVHGPLALSDPPALMFVSLALVAATSNSRFAPWLLGAASSAAIGCRPQYLVAVIPFLIATVILKSVGGRKGKLWRALAGFTIVSLLWFVPLVVATGGPLWFVNYQIAQAKYVAAHDAIVSRSGWDWPALINRFTAHPWGPKSLAMPVIVAALVGMRRMNRDWIPLLVLAIAQFSFCLWSADPADGVRYILPALLLVSFLAVMTLPRRFDVLAVIFVAVYAAAALSYSWPLIKARRSSPSPPVRAVTALSLVPEAVVGFDASLRGHAELLLKGRTALPLDRAIVSTARSDVSLFAFIEGASGLVGARTFSWPASDGYGKLTRNHYRVVSIVPVAPERRFIALSGGYPLERRIDGVEWRWLSRRAALLLPDRRCAAARLVLGLDERSVIAENRTTLSASRFSKSVVVRRGSSLTIDVPLGPGENRVNFDSSDAVTPLKKSGTLNRDPRELAVQLFDFRQVGCSAGVLQVAGF